MAILFLILSQFMINPTYEKIEYTQKDRQIIGAMVEKSGYMKECSITGPVGTKKGIIVLGMICAKNEGIQKARLGIDYEHKIYMRKYIK